MNIILEKQINEYFGKGVADISHDIAGLLDIISQTYNDFEHSIENADLEKAALKKRLKIEKEITDNELSNRIFFEQNLAGVYRTTTAGEIISCNEAFAAMLGYASP